MASKFMMFMEGKDKGLAGTPKVKVVADYDGPQKNNPPGGGKPYKATSGGKASGKKYSEMGDKTLSKLPGDVKVADKNAGQEQVKESLRRVRKPLNTEAFIDDTRNLSTAEFVQYMRNTAKVSGQMHEAVHNAAKVIKGSPSAILAFVQEAKRYGFFNSLMKEMLQHPEGYTALAKVLGDKNEGVDSARRLVRAVNEMVGPPAHEIGGLGGGKFGKGKPSLGLPSPDDEEEEDLGPEGDLGMDDDSDLGPDGEPGMDDEDDMASLHPDDDADLDDPDADPDAEEDSPVPSDDDEEDGPPGPSNSYDPSKMKFPRPSMMHRLMRKEANLTPAAKNLLEALGG